MAIYRKIASTFIFPIKSDPIKNGMIVLDHNGYVIDIVDRKSDYHEKEGVEYYTGIICPGFVNAHCNIELSHLKGKTTAGQGFNKFYDQVKLLNNTTEENANKYIKQADLLMRINGIVAVGSPSFDQSSVKLNNNCELLFAANYIRNAYCKLSDKELTQEEISKKPKESNLLLINNTYFDEADAYWLSTNRSATNTYMVTCPKSSLYIENMLPPYPILKNLCFPICIGTDSLASNNSLSVLEELKTLTKHFGKFTLNELLTFATINGAEALNIQQWAGSFDIGKRPGINLITGIDFENMRLSEKSTVKKIA